MTRPPKYVGVSGITTPEQAQAILDMWPGSAPPQSLMLGVLTSEKVQRGGERNPRSPAPEDIHRIWPADPRALNLVHYFTKDSSTLAEQILRVVGHPCDLCDGVQINVPWPPPEQIVEFLKWAPKLIRVVLQVGPKMLADYHHTVVAELIEREYRGLITDVLIDVSAGNGVSIDPAWAREIVEAFRAWNPDLGIGIAGRLCAMTLHGVADLVREYGLSTDTETAVRNDRDEFDLNAARAYLQVAAEIHGWR